MSFGAAEDIHKELVVRGFAPLSADQLRRMSSHGGWWWKQNSRRPYERAHSRHIKGNSVKSTVLDDGIESARNPCE